MYYDKYTRSVKAQVLMIEKLNAMLYAREDYDSSSNEELLQLCLLLGEASELNERQMANLELLVRVRDLGHVNAPAGLLSKTDPLTERDWELIQQHVERGYRIVGSSPEMRDVADLILQHHEHYDGNGYPNGISGNKIAIECRIMAAAEAYIAMLGGRPYRPAKTREEAIEELRELSGTQFDPDIVFYIDTMLEQGEYRI